MGDRARLSDGRIGLRQRCDLRRLGLRNARTIPPVPGGERTWQIEYRQNPKDGYWGPRGTFTERDGKFQWAGREFDSVYSVLVYRANNP